MFPPGGGMPPGGGGGLDPQLAAMLGGLAGGGGAGGGGMPAAMLEGLWDMPMIASIAFHPRPESPSCLGATTGPVRQGVFDVAGGDKVSYSLYVPPEGTEVKAVVFNFHGNAEVCTDIGMAAEFFHQIGAALLSIDYRGYAWGTGQASLTKLCGDASDCFVAAGKVLSDAGIGDARRIVMGRSIGATCAVHLAAMHASDVYGLVVDSGLMSIKELPMVAQMAPMVLGPQAPALFGALKEPFDTYGKLAAVSCPSLVMHGDKDQIVPMKQGENCHLRLACQDKKLRRWESAGHNDVLSLYLKEWESEIVELVGKALAFENPFPAGSLVETHSLSTAALNGAQVRVLGPQGDRMRVEFPDGEKALKPENLKMLHREPFAMGVQVEAHSLSAAAMNGLKGTVLGRGGKESDRISVDFGGEQGKKLLKPANLKRLG